MDIQDFHPNVVGEPELKLIKNMERAYSGLAAFIMESTATSAHQTAALRLLLESKMTIVHAISHQ